MHDESKVEYYRCIKKLEELELIRLSTSGEPVALFAVGVSIQPNGPLWKKYRGTAIAEFFKSDFSSSDSHLNLSVGYLSKANAKALQSKLEEIEREFLILASGNQRESNSREFYWILTATRTMNTNIIDVIASDSRFKSKF